MILGSHRAAADLCSLEPGTHLCALEPDGPHLDGVTFADAATIARLRSIAAALPQGGHLVLAQVPSVVRRILQATGLRHERLRFEP